MTDITNFLKSKYQCLKKVLLIIQLLIISAASNAQKLPKVQQVSLRAPSGIKIDGNAAEWNNQFQAYNSTDEVFYTIANDDDKLYLAIKATDALVIRKIINSGITFTIDPSGKKKDGEGMEVTYPVFDRKNWPVLNLRDIPQVTKDSTISSIQVDSFMRADNKILAEKAREIKILGVKSVDDTLISVYNQQGVRAVAQFDHQIAYVYELAIPLKHLGLSIDNPSKFSYNIRLNGAIGGNVEGSVETRHPWHLKLGPKPPSGIDFEYMFNPTDFWGEYVLAKK